MTRINESPKHYTLTTKSNFKIDMTLYSSDDYKDKPTILYLHGGGLLYGHRDDLPQVYIELILNKGYNLLSLDYPLAPEVNLKEILRSVYETVEALINSMFDTMGLTNNNYLIFGRSAGAYLALAACKKIIEKGTKPPHALISLYGYTGFNADAFISPSPYYTALPRVSDASAQSMLKNHYITQASIEERFSLYVKARQEGTWTKYIGIDLDFDDYCVTQDDLKSFPPTITAASTHDPDVPYRMSKSISRIVPRSKCITVYGHVHDFDRDIKNPLGLEVYEKIMTWIEQV
ncbi:alpha/beta hydrolase [Fusibacter sp. JL216-2]|uniref:alpha/beta hydrolase n=1 Tax=Fusibacter sp. JL216-2 TaxID=3071453 RepID=UPI003D342CAD